MLLKEYRICMPFSVEEYRIGQLYMIARHSAEESKGEGDGVEVVVNEPCQDEQHGDGRYTEKRIYLTSRLPGWVQSMIPRVFYITEKAWNYYPVTITEYTCSFLPKFLIQIDSTYINDNGKTHNALNYSDEMLSQRDVVAVDIATEDPSNSEYKPEQDCTKFKSSKTGRGPLDEGWKDRTEPIMCSYKAVKVFFEVWGMQTKVESAVHKAILDIIIKGHKQAFLWMDEWYGK
ncbi:Cytoplasmic phosphatidylinositol transfer protein 1 [Geodia barretti]|uniref:Cytoplasmic phosphatidylinositol transfer protein 1 n=1 Tax=Geodia barretti TaxID=519541 RepID=A0AA35RZB1_GEOBA|nr:Cytoplasmic phosphatidylinositol transfer protein 1 [Geodia barretti]